MGRLDHSEAMFPHVDPVGLTDATLERRISLLSVIAGEVEAELGFCHSEADARLEATDDFSRSLHQVIVENEERPNEAG